jgi:PAS domain S-box-containing protein
MSKPLVNDENRLSGDLASSALHQFPQAVTLADPTQADCPLVYINDRFTELTGYSAQQALGKNCRFLQGKETDPEAIRTIKEALSEQKSVTLSILNYRADGTPFTNELHLAPLTFEDGELALYLGLQNVRDDKLDEAGMEQLRRLQHRMKNHLSLVLAMIRLEAMQNPDESGFEDLQRRVETLSLLYEQFASADSSTQNVPLGAYLSRVCVAVQQISDPFFVRVNTSVDETHVDQDLAARVGLLLSETMDNALRHAFGPDEEDEIDFSLKCEEARAILQVRDTGSGMEEGAWPDATSLGGRIVRDLIARIKGELDISRPEGGGTVITITFPIPGKGTVEAQRPEGS